MVNSSTEIWCDTRTSNTKPMAVVKEKPASAVAAAASISHISKNGRNGEGKGTGSRRIFSPAFKLQVLDSYRQDADCQGNQRATARKYGIHRRQIQKWLQMETNLRSSVQQKCGGRPTTALNLSSAARQPDANTDCCRVSSSCSNHSSSVLTSSSNEFESEIPSPNTVLLKEESCSTSDSDEYVNVDEISDLEDEDETSSCSSYEKSDDKALDFTCATLSKRRFYTTDFKLHVLHAFRSDTTCKGNQRATARKFGIHRRQVQKWLNQEGLIKSEQIHPIINNDYNNNSDGNKNHNSTTPCPDLSHKRKLHEGAAAVVASADDVRSKKAKMLLPGDKIQESALCLIKNKTVDSCESNYHHNILSPGNYRPHNVSYPSALEHSYSPPNSSLSCYPPNSEYHPLYVYQQPWQCCYQQILSSATNSSFECLIPPKYSYAFNVKYEASYVNIPVQYGFGDSIPSKWLKDNPVFLQGLPSPYL